MGRLRRSRTHSSAKSQIKDRKTKRYGRDLDQIALDITLAHTIRSIKTPTSSVPHTFGCTSHPTVTGEVDEDTTGLGKWPCVECARFFVDQRSLDEHQRGKVHKRRSCLLPPHFSFYPKIVLFCWTLTSPFSPFCYWINLG